MISTNLRSLLAFAFLASAAIVSTGAARSAEKAGETITISLECPLLDAEQAARTVALPIEKRLLEVPGVSVSSSSCAGKSIIHVTFDADSQQTLEEARTATESQKAVAADRIRIFRDADPEDNPYIVLVALQSSTLPIGALAESAAEIGKRVATISGISQVSVLGVRRAIHLRLKPAELEARGIGLEEVEAAITANRSLVSSPQLLQSLVLAYRNGVPVQLGNVAEVVNETTEDADAAWLNNRPAVILAIQKLRKASENEITAAIRRLLPNWQGQLPAAVQMTLAAEPSKSIQAVVTFSEGASPQKNREVQDRISKTISEEPMVSSYVSMAGGRQRRWIISLKSPGSGDPSRQQTVAALRARAAEAVGEMLQIWDNSIPVHRYIVTGAEYENVARVAGKIEAQIRNLPGVLVCSDDAARSGTSTAWDFDEAKGSKLGITRRQVEDVIDMLNGGRRIVDEPEVRLDWKTAGVEPAESIRSLHIRGPKGPVPLDLLVAVKRTTGPLVVNHTAGLPSVTIRFQLRQDADINGDLQRLTLPSGVSGRLVY